ncbi:MAG: hypothetical protein RI909_860 [Bacteroidota bacterium]|jgi:uncharacterized protein YndB with AHSA1/START domain
MTNIEFNTAIEVNASTASVWDALINPEKIKQYLFGTNTFCDWKEGSPLRFTGEWEGKAYEDKGTILTIEKETVLSYDYWSNFSGVDDAPENYQIVTFRLKDKNGKTTLSLTQQNIRSEEAKVHSEENWNMVLNSLKALVEKG